MFKKETVFKTLVCIALMVTVGLFVSSCDKSTPDDNTSGNSSDKPDATPAVPAAGTAA